MPWTLNFTPPPDLFTSLTSLSNGDVIEITSTPTLPSAGGSFTDPEFGTKLIVLTDQNDGFDTQTDYSYWPSMNSDYTRFHLIIDQVTYGSGIATLYDFSASAETITRVENLYTSTTFAVGAMEQWSWTEPDVVYGVVNGEAILRQMTILAAGSRAYVTLKDFTNAMTGLAKLWQMSMDGTNRYFCFTARDSSAVDIGVVVWDRTGDQFWTHDLTGVNTTYDEARIDRSGTYVIISSNPGPAQLWEFRTGSTLSSFGVVVAHHDVHTNRCFTNNVTSPATWDLTAASLTGVSNFNNWYSGIDKHTSWLTTTTTYAMIGTFKSPLPWTEYQNEIINVRTDGSFQWRRLCHHRSDVANSTNELRSLPKGTISQDGRWFIFTTNWGNTRIGANSFHYGMMLKVPTEAEFTLGRYG